jgi:hypothetical protein
LGGGVDAVEVEVTALTAEAPRHRVIGPCGLVRGFEGPEGHAVAGGANLSVEVVCRPGAHVAVTGGATARRHDGAVRGRAVEKKREERV